MRAELSDNEKIIQLRWDHLTSKRIHTPSLALDSMGNTMYHMLVWFSLKFSYDFNISEDDVQNGPYCHAS